ncbi:hypothetical protein [Flavobacterium collinsii]|jgi:hypothetical protein|uniref:Uncharacterized protein n=2 Tax=Flavobacterium collinsii TaxID=1114861 RepID=A0A9W4X315_9FLAO|nr:hypothetical protein [Flavobacterium collinsii]GIQ57588.1 hypothetical protein Flavo103_07240 [Flavobacterium collinsii]CAA9201654.1 hypothetical protein FLACOL7796_03872 [Flavobacterium collinsii]CAI2766843.1 conserved protein of unknown function [Flavobacterium collinsii]
MQIKNIDGLSVSQIRDMVQQGGKFVVFPYTVSFILMTLKRSSDIYFIKANENTFKYSYGFVFLNLIVGWWGIPWGPIYTIGSAYHHVVGGKDLTQAVLSHLMQHDPEANTNTYTINGIESSNERSEVTEAPIYNIPV